MMREHLLKPGLRLPEGIWHLPVLSAIAIVLALLTVGMDYKVFLVLAVPLVLVMFKDPEIAFYVTTASTVTGFMYYLTDIDSTVTVSIPKILGMVTLLSLIIHNLYNRKSFYFDSRALVPILFITAIALIYAIAPTWELSTKRLLQLVGSFMFYYLAISIVENEASFRKLLLVVVAAYTVLSAYSIVQYFLPSQWVEEHELHLQGYYMAFVDRGIKRSSGTTHPGVFSFIVNMVIPYGIYLFMEGKSGKAKALSLASIATMVAAIILTKTRAAFLGLCLGLTFLWMRRVIRISLPTIPVLVFVVAFYGALLVPTTFVERVLSFSEYAHEGSVEVRVDNQRHALNFFLDEPLLGIGLGNFQRWVPTDRPYNRDVTDMVLDVACESGVAGLFLFGAFLFMVLKDAFSVEKWYRTRPGTNLGSIALASVLVSLFSSLFTSNQDFREWWLFMSFPVLLARMQRTATENPSSVDLQQPADNGAGGGGNVETPHRGVSTVGESAS